MANENNSSLPWHARRGEDITVLYGHSLSSAQHLFQVLGKGKIENWSFFLPLMSNKEKFINGKTEAVIKQ